MYKNLLQHKWLRCLIALLSLGAMTACDNAEFDFASEHAYFVFDNSIHQDATLQSALNPMSPGVFCRIYEQTEGSSLYFCFESNQGSSPTRQKANADEIRRTRVIGVYNKTGIIVGYGNLSTPATLYAYDSQCPNCYKETGMAQYRLYINSQGIATCPKCNRKYDLNNNGITDNGKKLMKYRANCTGALGVLSINN